MKINIRHNGDTVNVLSDGLCVLTVNPALSGDAGDVTVLASKNASGNVLVEMRIRPHGSMHLSRAALRFEFLPGDTTERWNACRESFHWLPNIKTAEKQFAGDHVFRSPAAILTSPTAPGVAVIPDLDTLAVCRPAPQYLDMGFPDGESPWIELGFASQKTAGHVYYEPTGEPFEVPSKGIRIAAWIIIAPREEFPGVATSFLWSQFAGKHTGDRRPQVMPFCQYADYGYSSALEHLWQEGPNEETGGITLTTFRKKEGGFRGRSFADDLFFHSWFNNARTAWGLGEWGKNLGHPDWVDKSKEIMNLALYAPRERGVFPAVYAPHDHGWEANKCEPYHIPDAAWTAIWIRKYHAEIAQIDGAPSLLDGLADFLLSAQSPDGGFPTWVERITLKRDARLDGAACGAMATWFLGEEALCPDLPAARKAAYVKAVMRSARHLREYVLPRLRFEDFELYYSCSGKNLDFYDKWTHSYGVNTLAIQWCAEAFRVAHLLGEGEGKETNLQAGKFCIDMMCLFQQVWNPPYLSLYAFGGFGAMNTDGEWHDARQAQFAETLANWHELTGKIEYKERAIAAARASFALMACDENKEIAPNNYQGTDIHFEVHGMMAENYGHEGVDKRSYQSGFHWGSGSALTTAARLIRRGVLDDLGKEVQRDQIPGNSC